MSDSETDIVIDTSTPAAALVAAREQCADGDYADAVELATIALERFASSDDTLTLARLLSLLASAHLALGEFDSSAVAADRSIALLDASSEGDPTELGVVLHTRAVVHLHAGAVDDATPLLDRSAETLDGVGLEARTDFCSVLLTMAEVASASGASDEARALCERVIAEMTTMVPSSEDHATVQNRVTARAFLGLGSALAQSGAVAAIDDAKDYLARAVEFFDAGYGHGHPEMTAGLQEIAALYGVLGDEDAAAVIAEELEVVAKL